MNVLGMNAYHGDSSACLIVDGRLVAAAEEERFRRIKHWAGFPSQAAAWCLSSAKLKLSDIDHVAVNRNSQANLSKKILFTFQNHPSLGAITDRLKNASKIGDIGERLRAEIGEGSPLRAKIHAVEHHRAHLASAFFVSPYDEAAAVSVDGFGDFVSTLWAYGQKNTLAVKDEVNFPHSLGLFYLALTQYLGFKNYGDEYKVMGLAPYGKPLELEKMRKIVRLKNKGLFELDLEYFLHHAGGVSMVWEKGEPVVGQAYSAALEALLGPPRQPDEPIDERHKNIAASMQVMYEEAFFHLLNHVQERTGSENLALAGGCAMNSVANGKVYRNTRFKKLYVQSAAGDAGGAIGAAFYVWNQELGKPRGFVMNHAYWGPSFTDEEIAVTLTANDEALRRGNCSVEIINNETGLCFKASQAIAAGKVVGWFQGRMEWGPRALGNRSILGDPRRADMKDILNLKIKRRESFRPFAPSILREKTVEWFEVDDDVPFMLQVYPIKENRRAQIPAVTHVNGSGRLQTVAQFQNPLYHKLISAFEAATGVPILLNTSFNENEPVVCKPAEALDCFLRTQMDVLVLGHYFIERNGKKPAQTGE